MKKSYFFVSATLAASILLLLVVILLFASGYRFSTVTVNGYGRVTYYGKADGGKVYLVGMTAEYDQSKDSLVFSNGDRYVGDIKNYLPNGVGVYTYGSGDSYAGHMVNGKPDGEGIYTFASGDTFEGSFSAGVFTYGTLTVTTKGKKETLTGAFEKSNFSGVFSYCFLDGTYYEGGYHNGLPNGAGKATLPNGDSYEGAFQNGYFSGLGTYTFADGSVLFCHFEKGVPNGRGSYTYTENGAKKSISGQFYDGYYLLDSES